MDLSRSMEPKKESLHYPESTYYGTSINLFCLGTLPVGPKEAVVSPKVGRQVGREGCSSPSSLF